MTYRGVEARCGYLYDGFDLKDVLKRCHSGVDCLKGPFQGRRKGRSDIMETVEWDVKWEAKA